MNIPDLFVAAIHSWALSIVVVFVLAVALNRLLLRLFGVVLISEGNIGVVNKRYVVMGANRTLPTGAIIAMKGEAGMQADTLAPGVHFGLWPWQYEVTRQPFITIKEGQVGIVEARDGNQVSSGRVLARHVDCNAFQDARAFLTGGGERGPQLSIIPPGTYRVNTALFTVAQEPAMEIADDKVGVVTTMDGAPLDKDDIAGGRVEGHNQFQDGQAFMDHGGRKGLQEQVLLAGRYYLNPRFVEVIEQGMTTVPIAHVGVVISYVGPKGDDVTGESFKHGNLVKRDQKGVWVDPLDPGKYPVNPLTHKVEMVPTANVVLNWATGKSEAHNLDANLSTIKVRSSDGFTFNLDVSQIIHIPRVDAPKVIARFGSMANLVTQVLEPTIGNYFRNAAQSSDVIEFLKNRKSRQDDAKAQILAALSDYNVAAVDTLIGDIVPPESLMATLTDRKLAEQQKVTFATQQLAEETRKALQQARATADSQESVVKAERAVEIAAFDATASIRKAEGSKQAAILKADGDAQAVKLAASAEAERIKIVGAAEASKTLAIGTSEADVVKLKIASMEAGNYAGIEIARSLSSSGFKLVPDVVVEGHGGEGGGLMQVLLAGVVRDSMDRRRGEDRRTDPVPAVVVTKRQKDS